MDSDTNYYLGLDIGTNSLGWAVTDPEYNILEYRRKAMWGIHLFDEGKTAADRRMHRCARRRLNRRKQRVTLLRELFSEEICKVDPSFFDRLDSSGLLLEDRVEKQKNSLFNDPNFTDEDYHHRYPTIYHLRKDLMEAQGRPDIRLVYLACHHIVKYRGHFLFGEVGSSQLPEFSDVIEGLYENITQYDETVHISDSDKLSQILSDRFKTVTDKKNDLSEVITSDSSFAKELSALLAGGKVKLSKLFEDESLKEYSICFKDSSSEEQMAELEDVLDGTDIFITLDLCKKVYDWSVLTSLLAGHSSISLAKVAQYDQHRNDLALLKKAIRTYAPEKYKEVFKDADVKGNYCSYAGICGKGKPVKSCDQEEFCKFIKKILQKTPIKEDDGFKDMMSRLDDMSFMPKQTSKENSVLPYSVHKMELEMILNRVSEYYPFLNEVDDDGFTKKDKVLMVQCFRIPYYVGPLGKGSERSWAVRRSSEPITPWNFEKVVDLDASAEGFIENLTNFCTYMVGEKVLPKNSIVYSYFQLYNELNNLKVNGEKIPQDIKRKMVEDLFQKKGKVTKKGLETYLRSQGLLDKDDEVTGINDSIKATLKSEISLRDIIGDRVENRKLSEDIIRTITIFGEESRIRSKLKNDHSDVLSEAEIKKLSKLRLDGWGRLSERLLTGLYDTCRETGQEMNILGLLEMTGDNFMEIYHKYSFKDQVEKHNRDMMTDDEVTYKSLDSLYISPAVKRSVWRTVSVVRDVVACSGHKPKKVFVETTRDVRGVNESKMTDSRKAKLVELYKNCREDPQWMSKLDGMEDSDLKSRNVYLYYTQLGRCMYCGKYIEFEELNNTNSFDRDHIYPQSKVKDDSIHNNMVLSCKECNGNKSDSYPISPTIQMKMRPMWDELLRKNYITSEKHSRLIRTSGFSDDELDRFISRQLVETSQSVKAVIEILHRLFGDETEIIYVKGGLVSEFRQEYGFIKCRSVNDYHHAKDAYLNIVVGNVYDTKFTKDPMNYLKTGEKYNLGKMYAREVSRNGVVAWTPEETGTISTVRKHMRRDNILFTRYQYISKGELFDDNLLRAKDTLFDRKVDRSASKYGGFDNPKGACYSLVEYEVKGKKVRSIEVLHRHSIGKLNNIVSLESYYSERVGSAVKVIVPIIRMNALFEWDNYRVHIGGRTGNNIVFYSAIQLLMPDDLYHYSKKLYKFDEDRKNRVSRPDSYYGIDSDVNIMLFDWLLMKTGVEPFSKMFRSLHDNMDSIRHSFTCDEPLAQAEVINEILKGLHCNPETTSFKKMGGVGLTGRIVLNKKLPTSTDVFIINQSPSGLNESKMKVNIG